MYSEVISKYVLCLKLRSVIFQIRHVEKAYVHPYFSPEQSSDIALLKLDEPLEFNDFVTNNGQRKNRQLDLPLDVITHYNQHQFVGKLSPHNLDGQTFTVGARYNVGEVAGQC